MHIKNSNNNKMRKIKFPSHNTQNNFLMMHIMQKITHCVPSWLQTKLMKRALELVALLDNGISRLFT
jgi:hypothetical protein